MKMNWQLSNSDIRWQRSHNHLAGSDEIPVALPLHVSYVICRTYQHKNETTLSPGSAVSSSKLHAQAISRLIDSCRMKHVQTIIKKLITLAQVYDSAFRPHYKADWNVLHYAVIFAVHLFEYSLFLWRSAVKQEHPLTLFLSRRHILTTHQACLADLYGAIFAYDYCGRLPYVRTSRQACRVN